MEMIKIDIGIEMISTILYFSNHYKIAEVFMGGNYKPRISKTYEDELTEWIMPYLNHEIFSYIDELTYKGFYFGRPIEIMCATDFETMTLNKSLSSVCLKYSGGMEHIVKLLVLLKDFAEVTNYRAFFNTIRKHYDKLIDYFDKHYDVKNIISIINQFYGYNENIYHVIWTDLQIGSYGICFKDSGRLDIFSVYTINGCFNLDEKSLETACGACSLNVIIHELSHPYVNPLTTRFINQVNQYKVAYKKLLMYKQNSAGYGDWEECINEHIVRAISIYLAKKIRNSEVEQWHYNKSYNIGYRYLPMLIEKLKDYDINRDSYQTFDDFYLELIKVFENDI